MTLKAIRKTVRELEPEPDEESSHFQTAVIMLSALGIGQNVRKLAKFTDYDLSFIKERAERLKANGIWKMGKTYADWQDEDEGGIAFWCDVCVAEGLMGRA